MSDLSHPRFKFMEKEVLNEAQMHARKLNAVEIGSGDGQFGNSLYRKINGKIRLFSIDPHTKPDVFAGRYRRESAEKIGLGDRSADVVFGSWFFEYLKDRAKATSEIRRILRPGGKLVLVLHHPSAYDFRFHKKGTKSYEEYGKELERAFKLRDEKRLREITNQETYHPGHTKENKANRDLIELLPQSIKWRGWEILVAKVLEDVERKKLASKNTFENETQIKQWLNRNGFEVEKISELKYIRTGDHLAFNDYGGFGIVARKKSE